MKVLYCDDCKELIRMTRYRRSCKCGRIQGKYLKDQSGVIWYYGENFMKDARVLAIDTNMIRGKIKDARSYVFDWKKSGLTVYKNDILMKRTKKHYGPRNAVVFLNNALSCLREDGESFDWVEMAKHKIEDKYKLDK